VKRTKQALLRALALCLLLAAPALAGCRSKVGSLRDALVEDDVARAGAIVDAPACTDSRCFDAIARAFGSKNGFQAGDPDQASAAAVAVVLVRDKRGDLVPEADRWIAATTLARGFGADALRLAVAHGMAEMAPRVGKRIDDEAEAAKLVHDLAGVLPGACETYVLLGSGDPASLEKLPPAKRPEHSPCVQRDLERKDGPGAAYGTGVWRAAAAIVALWKDEARALRTGLAETDEAARPALQAKLAVIDAATAKIALKTAAAAGGGSWSKEVQGVHGEMPVLPGAPATPPAAPAASRAP
jgi:hypothetical protein